MKIRRKIKFILWLFRKHKWHKDWLGCKICELRLSNNPDEAINYYQENKTLYQKPIPLTI